MTVRHRAVRESGWIVHLFADSVKVRGCELPSDQPRRCDKQLRPVEAVSKVTMIRAFSPREHCQSCTWRVAPGWYESGLWPSKRSQMSMSTAESACSYQPGAKPRVRVQSQEIRAEGPLHRFLRQPRKTGLCSVEVKSYRRDLLGHRRYDKAGQRIGGRSSIGGTLFLALPSPWRPRHSLVRQDQTVFRVEANAVPLQV